jgi:hypothetical protein
MAVLPAPRDVEKQAKKAIKAYARKNGHRKIEFDLANPPVVCDGLVLIYTTVPYKRWAVCKRTWTVTPLEGARIS